MAKKKTEQVNPEDAQVHLVFGEDDFLAHQAAEKIVNALCPPEEQALGMETLEGDSANSDEAINCIKRCIGALRTIGFFGGRKVVWLRGVTFLGSGFRASEELKEVIAQLKDEVANGLGPDQFLIISATKIDKRGAFYKACNKAGAVQEFAIPERDYQARPLAEEKARTLLTEKGIRMDGQTMERFLGKTGFDTRSIAQEVEKLSLYLGDRDSVTPEDVAMIVSASKDSATWDLVDAVAERNLPLALQVLNQLLFQGDNAVAMIIAIENRFRELALFRDCIDCRVLSVDAYGRRVNLKWSENPKVDQLLSGMTPVPRSIHSFRAGLLAGQAKKYAAAELNERLDWLLETHRQLVTTGLSGGVLLEILIVRMCAKKQRRAV
ncbi:DNA polymerase III subunit delta [Verrucomicrobiota bacterium]